VNATDIFTATGHSLANGDIVYFTGTTQPTGMTFGNGYFVRNRTANTFQVSAGPASTTALFTSDGAGLVVHSTNAYATTPNVDDTIAAAGHSFQAGDIVSFNGTTVPGGIAFNTNYYVINPVSGVNFMVSTTLNGNQVNITSAGGAVTVSQKNLISFGAANLYYVVNSNADDFQVSKAGGGAAINFISAGSGIQVQKLLAGSYNFDTPVVIDSDGSVGAWADISLMGGVPYVSYLSSSAVGTLEGLKVAWVRSGTGSTSADWEYAIVPVMDPVRDHRTNIATSSTLDIGRYVAGTPEAADVALGYAGEYFNLAYRKKE
jgi:hypothetical protein